MTEPDASQDAPKAEEGEQSPPLYARTRLPFENERISLRGQAKGAGVALYGLIVLACVGAALYMALVVRHPILSAYVMAPAVGAAWFAARLLMMLGPKR